MCAKGVWGNPDSVTGERKTQSCSGLDDRASDLFKIVWWKMAYSASFIEEEKEDKNETGNQI